MELVRQKNVATIIVFPIVDADGDLVTGAAGLDSEIDSWADGTAPDGFADCTNEATEIGTTGQYYLSLSQSEMNADYIIIQVKTSTSGAKTQTILIRTMVGDPLNAATTDDGGAINVASGVVEANAVQVSGDATAADNLEAYCDGTTPQPVNTTQIAGSAVATGSAQLGVNVVNWKGSAAPNMTGDAYARLGAPAGASVSADVAAVKSDTAAVLLDTGTDGVVVAAASKTGYALATTPPTATQIRQEIDSNSTQLAAIVADTNELQLEFVNGGRLDLLIDSILADTDEIQQELANGGRLDLLIDAILEDTGTTIPATLSTIAGYIDTEVAAILAAVDTEIASIISTLGAAGAGLTAIPWNAAWDAEVQSECMDAINAYDPPTNAEMVARTLAAADYATAAALATVDGIVDEILTDTGTTLPGTLTTISTDIAAIKAETASIVADTNELQMEWVDGGRLDLILDAIQGDLEGAFTDATSLTANSLRDRMRTLMWIERNKMEITDANGNMVIYKDDGTTSAFTVSAALTDDSTTTTRKRIE